MIDDPLCHLPRTRIAEITSRAPIYPAPGSAAALYVTISGRVRIDCTSDSGRRVLLRIVGPEQLFGNCLRVEGLDHQNATAVTKVRLMCWSAEELDERMARNPTLAIALCAHFNRQNLLTAQRISAMQTLTTGPRTALGLLHLGEMCGERMPDGTMRMQGLTHRTVAEYVGTSREIVTVELNRLRREGFVTYGPSCLVAHDDALRAWLRQTQPQAQPLLRAVEPAAAV